jgi:putative zinc finger/helix-turn-helix YgiT family protein
MTLSSSPTRAKCPECEHGHLVPFSRDEEFDYDLGEESIKVVARDVPVERCDSCGMVASGPAAAKVRHEAVCRAAGFLTPTEYKSIREELGWSQQRLADLTGCGVATVSRAERGRIMPNRIYDNVLRAIRDCPAFREHLQGRLAAGRESGAGGTSAEAKQQVATPAKGDGETRTAPVHVNRIRLRLLKVESRSTVKSLPRTHAHELN